MDSKTLGTLAVVLAVAVFSPFLANLLARFRVTAVVIEVLSVTTDPLIAFSPPAGQPVRT